jgi:hypothetical protein
MYFFLAGMITGNFAAHFDSFRLYPMQITYCVNEDNIQVIDHHEESRQDQPLFYVDSKRYLLSHINLTKCARPLSVMHINQAIKDMGGITFIPSTRKGVVVCIQQVKEGSLMEFNTSDCMEMDYRRSIIDIRFISTAIPFKFKYKGGNLRRFDIFFPKEEMSEFLNKQSLSRLEARGHFGINKMEMQSSAKKIETILMESKCDFTTEEICRQVNKLVLLIKKMQ